jgi:hypothetical protein
MATKTDKDKRIETHDRNEDPITGEPGAHPVSVGVGTAAGGAAAGAAAGAVAGPVGAAVGAVVGGVAGGLAGKAVGEQIDPTAEETYWRDNYRSRGYVREGETFETYQPAYRYGVESATRHGDRPYGDIETDLRSGWGSYAGGSNLDWDRASPAVRDAYERVYGRRTGASCPPKTTTR